MFFSNKKNKRSKDLESLDSKELLSSISRFGDLSETDLQALKIVARRNGMSKDFDNAKVWDLSKNDDDDDDALIDLCYKLDKIESRKQK